MIKSLKLTNFRLFSKGEFKFDNSLVIFSGKNATGKTTILEAIYLASTSKSHRENDLTNLIKNGEKYLKLEVAADNNYKIVISNEEKSFSINNSLKKNKEFVGDLNVVMFSPSDLDLINGAKLVRRKFLDLELSLIYKQYLKNLSEYKKYLSERNELLKNPNLDKVYLDVVTNELIKRLEFIYNYRVSFINELNRYLVDISKKLNVPLINLKYVKTYSDDLEKSFKEKLDRDIFSKTTNIGAHRDDFEIYLDNLNAMVYASEGQKRIICIAIKLALKEYIKNKLNKEVILLLDDVFATLDSERIASLTKYIVESNQAFITTTSVFEIPDEIIKKAIVIRMDRKV